MDEAEIFRLQLLLSRIGTLAEQYGDLLAGPRRAMDDHAWVGPSAGGFGSRLSGGERALKAQLGKAHDLIEARLRRGPML
ncbi:hypothetical protein [Actinomadura parmotrematis]|uniref:WXG100 family type VII secretion target n=1 Tax=Actinomadura parmotrematis TaxID=2864039 RepID=A0ABS7FWA6_9ACTN|nr:hypothetical protein [Actinomadura parmotrematis]MBW8484714.1 hypothetical protein [Actinomadura parmotrematis]